MVDYSKWDNINESSEDETRAPAVLPPRAPVVPVAPAVVEPPPANATPDILHHWPMLGEDERVRVRAYLAEQELIAGYVRIALEPALFDASQWRRWVRPEGLAVADAYEANGSVAAVDGAARVEAPGVVSFPLFTDEFCEKLLAEVEHYNGRGLPARPPNSMNQFGLVLNDVGLRPLFSKLLRRVLRPFGARLFGDAGDRASAVGGADHSGQDWGGSSLDDHHTFVVRYAPDDDAHLDMHIDECDVTFNISLSASGDFEGNSLTFCGMHDSLDHRTLSHTYRHSRGRCVAHSGKRRHGALDITGGKRASLVVWTKSSKFRSSPAYEKSLAVPPNNGGHVDRVCLSYTHDADYKTLMPKRNRYKMGPDGPLLSPSAPAPRSKRKWLAVCPSAALEEGSSRKLVLDEENEQVAVFRRNGQLFAIDNRCAHMGGDLSAGDIEDLRTLRARRRKAGTKRPPPPAAGEEADAVVRCPRHGLCFNVRTGDHVDDPAGATRQRVFPVRERAGRIQVLVDVEVDEPVGPPPPPPAGSFRDFLATRK